MLLSTRATDASLNGEWVAVHELSHLLLPPINRDDSWLSEGLASYYQEILRGRSGLLDVDVAWASLLDGFARGKREARSRPLREASERMHNDFNFVSVYWGGAAIMLNLDTALRQKGRSLDELVAAVRVREPVDVEFRSADEVISWFAASAPDVDVQGIVATGLAARFPDVDGTLQALGVTHARGGKLVLDDNAPLAAIRRGISSGRSDRR
jgi:hypothetical protein